MVSFGARLAGLGALGVGGAAGTLQYEASAYSRRKLLHRGAAAFGGFVGFGLLAPETVLARANPAPRPIPGGLDKTFMPVPRHGHHRRLRDKKFGFEGKYITGPTTVTFTARQHGSSVVCRSVPTGQYNPTVKQMGAGSPAVGHERNGVFFR